MEEREANERNERAEGGNLSLRSGWQTVAINDTRRQSQQQPPLFSWIAQLFVRVCVCSSFVAIRVLTISHFSQRPLGALPLLVDGRTRSCNPGETDGISMYQSFKVHHRRNKKKEVQSHQSVESWTVHTKYSKLFPLGPLSSPFFSYLLLLL